jgi:hypothetical protein
MLDAFRYPRRTTSTLLQTRRHPSTPQPPTPYALCPTRPQSFCPKSFCLFLTSASKHPSPRQLPALYALRSTLYALRSTLYALRSTLRPLSSLNQQGLLVYGSALRPTLLDAFRYGKINQHQARSGVGLRRLGLGPNAINPRGGPQDEPIAHQCRSGHPHVVLRQFVRVQHSEVVAGR